MSTHRQYFPDDEDATGAAKALMRLQDTYQLDSEAFARGKLPGIISGKVVVVTKLNFVKILQYCIHKLSE